MPHQSANDALPAIGWREWVKLPELGIETIKAKVDTGARSSSLHAVDIETFRRGNRGFVRFKVHPEQRDSSQSVVAEAELLGLRHVRSSTGHSCERPVICTMIELLGRRWRIELTLAPRDEMGFRMLLGREALRGRVTVNPGRSYLGGKRKRRRKKLKARPRRGRHE
jgi:hypothetical protein